MSYLKINSDALLIWEGLLVVTFAKANIDMIDRMKESFHYPPVEYHLLHHIKNSDTFPFFTSDNPS